MFLLFFSKLLEILEFRNTRESAFVDDINILTVFSLVAVNCRRFKEVYNKYLV